MTIDITEAGLAEINGDSANVNGHLYKGYSNYTLRITYTATINSDDSFIYGEAGNDNEVVMTWKRTSTEYYDTLIDDCHVFSFGLDLTKIFSDIDSESATEMDCSFGTCFLRSLNITYRSKGILSSVPGCL